MPDRVKYPECDLLDRLPISESSQTAFDGARRAQEILTAWIAQDALKDAGRE